MVSTRQPLPAEPLPEQTSSPVAIVAAGNWLVAHDRIGFRVLELVTGRYGPKIALFDTGSAGLGLLDCIQGQKLLIIVDAGVFGGRPGEIRIDKPNLETSLPPQTSVHQIGPLETLIVAKHLWPEKIPKRILLIQVETEGIDQATLEEACRRVVSILDRELSVYQPDMAVGHREV